MKTLTIGPVTLIWATGKDRAKLKHVDKIGTTHHIHRNQKGGPRKARVEPASISGLQGKTGRQIPSVSQEMWASEETKAEEAETLGTGPAFKRDCQRWKECMDENPMQRLAGCGRGDDICDGYLPPETEASHVSD